MQNNSACVCVCVWEKEEAKDFIEYSSYSVLAHNLQGPVQNENSGPLFKKSREQFFLSYMVSLLICCIFVVLCVFVCPLFSVILPQA